MPKYAKIGHKGLNKQKKKKKKTPKKPKISRDCRHWGHVFVFFVFFVFLFFQAPKEGCRELSLFMPQGKDAEC